MSYIKLNRESAMLDFILKERPTAMLLLLLIAKRAKRTVDHPDKRLEIGEAYIGDFETYGQTRQKYRSDKAYLKSTNQITTRTTNKGTIAKLISTLVFDVNEEIKTESQPSNQPTNQLTINQQLTTNKNDKNEKNEYIPDFSDAELSEVAQKYKIPLAAVQTKFDALRNYCLSTGKRYKDYKAALRNFVSRDIEKGLIKTEAQRLQEENPDIPNIASRIT